MQGNLVLLSELQPKGLNYVIHVRVSRMWEHTGGDENNDVKHLDLVLIDQKGNAIYAEIPPNAIPVCKPHLQEGKIVYMAKITVERAKQFYKVVDHPYMIRLNKFTLIKEADNYPEDFPKYTFSLTPFTSLPHHLRSKEKFLDVIGRIVVVSNAANVYSASGNIMPRRVVKLQDLSGNILDISLGGKRALEFDGDEVLRVGQQNHVIAIFVGTLMKVYNKEGLQFLSGTSACRWYINENDILEIKAFQKSLPPTTQPIQQLLLQNEDETKQSFEKKTLLQLKDIDPFTEKDKKYECTVTITGVRERKPWCYRACTVDNHNIRLEDNAFKCTKQGCTNTKFDWKYKIPFKEKFGKETFFPKPESCQVLSIGSSSSASATYKNLPLLVPIGSKKIDHQVLQHSGETENMDLDQQSGNNTELKQELENDIPRLKKMRSQ